MTQEWKKKKMEKTKPTFDICSSVYSSNGPKLLLTVPADMVGPWGIMLADIISQSNRQLGRHSGKVCTRVDFPLPAHPIMPVLIPRVKVDVRPHNIIGMCGAYRTYNLCMRITNKNHKLKQFLIQYWTISLVWKYKKQKYMFLEKVALSVQLHPPFYYLANLGNFNSPCKCSNYQDNIKFVGLQCY